MTRSERLKRHDGILGSIHGSGWLSHWREPYLLALSIPWPGFLALVVLVDLGIGLLFAGLYLLDPTGIAGAQGPGGHLQAAEALFFSVQTLSSVAYGVLHPVSFYANSVVTVESLIGLLIMALTTGLAFARFTRGTARIRFSQRAVVHTYNGVPVLSFRLANERRNTLLDAKLRAYLAIDEVSLEGHRMRRLLPLLLERDQGIAFLLIWTVMHRIDEASPLHGLSVEDLQRCQAEVVVAFSGVDETIERTVHARASWPQERLAYGRCFVDLLDHQAGEARVDWQRFDRTRPCPLPD